MSEITIKFLIAGDKFMPEMHLRQASITYRACGPFTNSKERIQKFQERGDSRYIYRNELDRAWFQHDIVYGGFKDLPRRTASDKLLLDKAFDIAKNPENEDLQRVLASMIFKHFDKKSSGGAVRRPQSGTLATLDKFVIKCQIKPKQQLPKDLHKPIITNIIKLKSIFIFKKQYLGCWSSNRQLINKYNDEFRLLLCVVDIFNKCA